MVGKTGGKRDGNNSFALTDCPREEVLMRCRFALGDQNPSMSQSRQKGRDARVRLPACPAAVLGTAGLNEGVDGHAHLAANVLLPQPLLRGR